MIRAKSDGNGTLPRSPAGSWVAARTNKVASIRHSVRLAPVDSVPRVAGGEIFPPDLLVPFQPPSAAAAETILRTRHLPATAPVDQHAAPNDRTPALRRPVGELLSQTAA